MKKNTFFRLILALLTALASVAVACAGSGIEKGFAHDTTLEESQNTITKYCLSCHPHKEFKPSVHEEDLKKKFVKATVGDFRFDCRECHSYSKNWFFDVKRGTHRLKENG